MMHIILALVAPLCFAAVSSESSQVPLGHPTSEWTKFSHPIRRVAVIGAGPSGLQSAATLIQQNFTVRLFERDDVPGGNWRYSELTPVRESYPDKPLHVASYEPDIRPPGTVEWYKDGDDGLTLEERWSEAVRPSPIWNNLHSNSAPVFTSLPDVDYPKDVPWVLSAHQIQRHVRTFASFHGINSNDLPSSITSYCTRVEYIHKEGDTWILHLRRLERPSHSQQIRAEWWTEEFDAVVVATNSADSPHVPAIEGLGDWAQAKDGDRHVVWHSQSYRRPEYYANKTVLIVGASVSASEISRDIGPYAKSLYLSIRDKPRLSYTQRRSIRRMYPNSEQLKEIAEFKPLAGFTSGISGGTIVLKNGTKITGIDEIILATGFKRSNPFLRDYIQAKNPEASPELEPIITPGIAGLQSLHWTGHYIPDPTLAFTNVRAWTNGRYQSLGFAKVWKGTARIPNQEKLWEQYPGAGKSRFGEGSFGSYTEETLSRYFVAWLNSESLVHGGRFVDAWPVENREMFVYYADQAWEQGYTTSQNFTDIENTPASEWKYSALEEELAW